MIEPAPEERDDDEDARIRRPTTAARTRSRARHAPSGRTTRSSTSDRIRCGSWSTTSSAARRCPGSTRSRSAGSPKASPRPARIAPDGFRRTVEAVRRFRAIADAMGVSQDRRHRHRGDAPRLQRTGARGRNRARRPGSRFASSSGAEEARYATLGVISGFFRPVGTVGDMGGGSLEVAEAIDDHVGRRLGQPAARRAAGRGDARGGRCGGQAPGRRDPASGPRSSAGAAGVLSGRRRLARARQGPHRGGRRSGQGRARLYAGSIGRARFRQIAVASLACQARGDAGRRRASGAHPAGRGAGAWIGC